MSKQECQECECYCETPTEIEDKTGKYYICCNDMGIPADNQPGKVQCHECLKNDTELN